MQPPSKRMITSILARISCFRWRALPTRVSRAAAAAEVELAGAVAEVEAGAVAEVEAGAVVEGGSVAAVAVAGVLRGEVAGEEASDGEEVEAVRISYRF